MEEARARLIALFPEGFEERALSDGLELAAYADEQREAALREQFEGVVVETVASGWSEAWRNFHRPVRVGPLWLGPPWEEPDPGSVAIVIDPGQAFGTGAHATTRLCLELLLEEPTGSLLDLGCGSGVLAVSAAKLGFGPILAVDSDPRAVDAATTNAAANRVSIDVVLGDVLDDPLPSAGLAVANLELGLIQRLGSTIDVSHLIASGYLVTDRCELAGWVVEDRRSRDGWVAERHVRR